MNHHYHFLLVNHQLATKTHYPMIIIPLSSTIPKCFRKKKVRTWVRTWLSVKKSESSTGWLDPLKAGHAAAEILLRSTKTCRTSSIIKLTKSQTYIHSVSKLRYIYVHMSIWTTNKYCYPISLLVHSFPMVSLLWIILIPNECGSVSPSHNNWGIFNGSCLFIDVSLA